MRSALQRLVVLAPCVLWAACASAGTGRLELPSLVGGSEARVVSLRVTLAPEPAGVFRAETSLAVLNGSAARSRVELRIPAGEPGTAVVADRAGEPLVVAQGRAALELEPSEAAVVRVTQVVSPQLRHALDRGEAGWWGTSRGHLLQPVRRLEIVPAAGTSALPVEASVTLQGRPLASALFTVPTARYADGVVSWSVASGETLVLAWPAVENETFVPRDREEASAFLVSWAQDRLPSTELDRVRRAVAETSATGSLTGREAWSLPWPSTDNEARESAEALHRAEPPAATPRAPVAKPAAPEPPPQVAVARAPEPVAAPPPARRPPAPEPARPEKPPEPEPARVEAPVRPAPEPAPVEAPEPVGTPEPEAVSGPEIPWIRTPAQARVFLAEEKRRGPLDAPRLRAAIALLEARLGNPFATAPGTRARFRDETWYAPDDSYSPARLPTAAREALTLLRTALESAD